MSTQRIIKTINDTCRRTLVKIQNAIWSSYHIIYSTEGLTVKSGKLKHQNDSMEVQHCTQDEHSEDKAVLIWKAGCPNVNQLLPGSSTFTVLTSTSLAAVRSVRLPPSSKIAQTVKHKTLAMNGKVKAASWVPDL